MTLSVLTYTRKQDTGDIVFDEYPKNGEDMAGPETWRNTLWSCDAIKEQGATFLPQLSKHDLYIEFDNLGVFLIEIEMLILSVNNWGENDEGILHKLENFKKAVNTAISNKGGVHIG